MTNMFIPIYEMDIFTLKSLLNNEHNVFLQFKNSILELNFKKSIPTWNINNSERNARHLKYIKTIDYRIL